MFLRTLGRCSNVGSSYPQCEQVTERDLAVSAWTDAVEIIIIILLFLRF